METMKRALVTAATSSIGKVICKYLHEAGYEVVAHYNSNEKLARELSPKILQADFTKDGEIDRFVDLLVKGNKFDLVVNCAGVSVGNDWEKQFRVSVEAIAKVLERAREIVNAGGVIVNMSSAYGHERAGNAGLPAYSASKAAVNSLTRTFAKQLAPDIRVNAVAPGYVISKWNEKYTQNQLENLASDGLTGKLVTPEQVAEVVMLCVTNEALDGEVIYVDTGLTLKTI